jgi:REP element-mobilizing transposase RayT
MDESQADKKSPNIWNKFESAAPGVPDWIQNKEQTSSILQTLIKTIPAKAVLISTTTDVFLLVGEMDENTQGKILQVLAHFWDSVQKSDLTRYLKNAQGEVTGFIFCANLFQQLILTVYYQDTPTLSMARAHTKRITRALSGQTVASYEAKTIPVDAAVAAQMRKFYEQLAKQKEGTADAEELPKANVGPAAPIETPPAEPAPVVQAPVEEPVFDKADSVISDILTDEEAGIEEESSEALLPSMEDLLGDPVDTRDVDISTSAVIEEIENQSVPEAPVEPAVEESQEIKIDFQNAGIDANSGDIEEISEEDLALLSDELDDFFMDDDSDIDLEEQKEKLAALLQEMPAPDPDGAPINPLPEEEMAGMFQENFEQPAPQSESAAGEPFTLPWEGESSPDSPTTAPVNIEESMELATAQEETPAEEPVKTVQQPQEKPETGPRPFTIVLLPRIPFHELGAPFEKKFEHYFKLTCQVIDCEADTVQIFSDHVQLKFTFSGKGSVARTIIQLKKLLELKIIENYSTLSEDLGDKELWIPGQLLFNENEKVDSKRIQAFIKNAQS